MKKQKFYYLKNIVLGVVSCSFFALSVQADGLTKEQKLGSLLYKDTNLSINKNQACATCHSLKKLKLAGGKKFTAPGFVDPANVQTHSVTSAGSIPGKFGGLNAPSAGYAAFSPDFFFDGELWIGGQFWNGRAATLEEQAKAPFLNPVEMAMPSRWAVISEIKENNRYNRLFHRVYGFHLDEIDSNIMAPADPTDPEQLALVIKAYDLMATAIAQFERSRIFNKFNSKFDAVNLGITTYTALEAKGLELFSNEEDGGAKCSLCHVLGESVNPADPDGDTFPTVFTDFSYDNIGIPRTTSIHGNPSPDIGLGATTMDSDNDGVKDTGDNGKHKVMSLRNIAITAPYGHNGYFKDLAHIVHFYNTRDVPSEGWAAPEVTENVNTDELGDLGLSHEDEHAIVAFLKTLTDGYFEIDD